MGGDHVDAGGVGLLPDEELGQGGIGLAHGEMLDEVLVLGPLVRVARGGRALGRLRAQMLDGGAGEKVSETADSPFLKE